MSSSHNIFSIEVNGRFTLDISIGSYALPLEGAPNGKILRIAGVGEFQIPGEVYDEAVSSTGTLSSNDASKARIFLEKILASRFTKVR